jgi:hypothetical protein
MYQNQRVNWSDFDYPLESFHDNVGGWSYEPVDGESDEILNGPNGPNGLNGPIPEKEMLDYDQFEKVYYVRPGENDGENWTFLVRHKNGFFVFFDAGCDYTGFDCCGGGTFVLQTRTVTNILVGTITYTQSAQKMWWLGLTDAWRNEFQKLKDFSFP